MAGRPVLLPVAAAQPTGKSRSVQIPATIGSVGRTPAQHSSARNQQTNSPVRVMPCPRSSAIVQSPRSRTLDLAPAQTRGGLNDDQDASIAHSGDSHNHSHDRGRLIGLCLGDSLCGLRGGRDVRGRSCDLLWRCRRRRGPGKGRLCLCSRPVHGLGDCIRVERGWRMRVQHPRGDIGDPLVLITTNTRPVPSLRA